jgi:hypothetical protein
VVEKASSIAQEKEWSMKGKGSTKIDYSKCSLFIKGFCITLCPVCTIYELVI